MQSKKFWHNQYTIPILVAFLIPSFVWGVTTIGENIITGGQLTVSGTATSTIAGDVNFDSNTFYVDSVNNRVGVGTNNPQVAFEVMGAVSAPYYSQMIIGLDNTKYLSWGHGGNNAFINMVGTGHLAFRQNGLNALAVHDTTGVSLGDTFYAIDPGNDNLILEGKLGIATSTPSAQLAVEGQGSTPSLIVSDSSDNTDFIVTADGKVGVGTASPTQALEVSGLILASLGGNKSIGLSTPSAQTGIVANSTGGVRSDIIFKDVGILLEPGNNSSLGSLFDTQGKLGIATTTPWGQLSVKGQGTEPSLVVSDSSDNTDFIVTANGKVGVGTASPTQALEVTGSIKLNSGHITGVWDVIAQGGLLEGNSLTIQSHNGFISRIYGHGNRMGLTFIDDTDASNRYGNIRVTTNGGTWLELVTDSGLLKMTDDGFIGIGTSVPESRLQVTGGGLCVGSDANCNSDNNTEGTVYAATTAMTTYDLAENYPTKDHTLKPGDVVALDTTQNGPYVKRAEQGDVIIGAISKEPGALLGGFNGAQYAHEKQVPVALSGRIDINVSTENGNIKSGDYLELSSTPGVATKATGNGKVIGIALESFSGEGVGEVLVFVESHDSAELKAELTEQVKVNTRQQAEIDDLRVLIKELYEQINNEQHQE